MRYPRPLSIVLAGALALGVAGVPMVTSAQAAQRTACLLYTSDAADERSSVDLGGRRIIKKKRYICGSYRTKS